MQGAMSLKKVTVLSIFFSNAIVADVCSPNSSVMCQHPRNVSKLCCKAISLEADGLLLEAAEAYAQCFLALSKPEAADETVLTIISRSCADRATVDGARAALGELLGNKRSRTAAGMLNLRRGLDLCPSSTLEAPLPEGVQPTRAVKFARKACRNLQDEFIKHGESSAGARAKEELLTGLMILADIHSRQVQQPCPEHPRTNHHSKNQHLRLNPVAPATRGSWTTHGRRTKRRSRCASRPRTARACSPPSPSSALRRRALQRHLHSTGGPTRCTWPATAGSAPPWTSSSSSQGSRDPQAPPRRARRTRRVARCERR
jgi:hypothetical protein